MPPRLESELDPVTLHNMALVTADANPSESFDKLQFLLQQQVALQSQQAEIQQDLIVNSGGGGGNAPAAVPLACPPETFANLLLLYCKFEYFDMAADLLAEHADLTYKHLSSVSVHIFHHKLPRFKNNKKLLDRSTHSTSSKRSLHSRHHRKRHSPSLMPCASVTVRE